MKAVIQSEYGQADLRIENVPRPEIGDAEVLIEVRAASIHAGDALMMQGRPYVFRAGTGLRRPRTATPGLDLAGTVVSVGPEVTRFRAGDEVFGEGKSSLAEYAKAKESRLALKPAGLTFEQAAVLTVSGLTALRAVRDVGNVQSGQSVLIVGAAGGIGTYAVQIAKAMGATVTGVCSGAKADLVRSLGADHVIDYTQEDFTTGDQKYDFILDNVGTTSLSDMRKVLAPEGTLVPNSGTSGGQWFGPIPTMVRALATSPFVSQNFRLFVSIPNEADLDALVDLVESGDVVPVVGATYPLDDAQQAFSELTSGHATGKVAITVA